MADDVSSLNSWEEGGRENRRMRVMVEVWRHGVTRLWPIKLPTVYYESKAREPLEDIACTLPLA
jgi:hypothetical protein